MKKKDLEQSLDKFGNASLFIEERHFINGKSELDSTTKKCLELTFANSKNIFFRIIKNGVQKKGHGYIKPNTFDIIQFTD